MRAQGRGKAILLTPPGAAAIAVVRLVGDGALDFVETCFDKAIIPGRCVHGTLSDGGRVIDDPVVVASPDGRVADLNLHGGPQVVRSVLETARRHGFDVLEAPAVPLPPEAVDGPTEIAREVLRFLPMASTELAVRTLLAQEEAWRRFRPSPSGGPTISGVRDDRALYWLLHPPRVAIVGVPNSGKSSLANRLFAQERSITADLPGTTRDWVGEVANVDGLAVTLVDTPGLRETADLIEREAIGRSREVVGGADLVLLVLDPTQPRAPAQQGLERDYPSALQVLNKCDLAPVWGGGPAGGVRTVATTGEGVDDLRGAIRRHFLGPDPFVVDRPRWWTPRQRLALDGMTGAAAPP